MKLRVEREREREREGRMDGWMDAITLKKRQIKKNSV